LKQTSKLDGLSPEERTQLASRLSAAKRQAASNKAAGLVVVRPDVPHRWEPFPLTDLQQAYLFGRSEGIELGNISCHGYAEVDVDHWDRERFEAALQRMIERHEMLRCIVLPEGRQQILPSTPPYKIGVNDLRALDAVTAAARLDSIRAQMSHKVHPSDQWPLFEFRASLLDAQRSRLHISNDLLIGDGRSFEILLQELMQLYHHPEAALPPIELSFRDYVQALASLEQTDAFRESRDYWVHQFRCCPPRRNCPWRRTPLRFLSRYSSAAPPAWTRRLGGT